MGTILLTPDQIPQLWETIKFAAVNAEHVESEFRDRYLNTLLYQLLSSKAQCFIRLSDERKVQAVAITRIQVDETRDEKALHVPCLYSFVKVDDETWKEDIQVLVRYAKKNGCKFMTAWATSDKISSLISMLGMRERFKSFVMEV